MNLALPAAAGLALVLAAQQQPSQQPAPRFKATTDVVRVDVNVVDDQGRPIRNLTVADFELKVDGRPRKIATVQFASVDDANVGLPVAKASAPPVEYTSNVEEAGGRLIMIVIDRGSIAAGRGKAVFESASRFIGGLNRADRVALASIPYGPHIDFTADHALVQRMIQGVDGEAILNPGQYNIGVADALAFERKDTYVMDAALERECGLTANARGSQSELLVCRNQVTSEAMVAATDAREKARNSIIGLQSILDRLPPSATPKVLVYISEGLVIDRERYQLSWLAPRAAAAHVTVYSLLLESTDTDASRRRPPARAAADRAALEDGLAQVSQVTRGDVFRVMSNSEFAFRRLSAELSGYYLLGFEAEAGDRNGKPHPIKVEVRRKGVTVRSRQEFTIGAAPDNTTNSEIVAALRDPLPATDIPLKVTTYSLQDPRSSKLRVLVAAEIDRSINPQGTISVGYVLVDFNRKLAASQVDTPPAQPNGSVQHYFSAIPVDPGRYTLKLVAVDDAGRRGSVERVVNATLSKAGPIQATDLLVADAGSAQKEMPLTPAVDADFSGDTLHGYLEIFADAPEVLEMATVTLEVAKTESSPALESAAVQLQTPKGDAKCRIAGASVGIAQLPPGDYVARAVIAVGGKPVGQVLRPFRVARSG